MRLKVRHLLRFLPTELLVSGERAVRGTCRSSRSNSIFGRLVGLSPGEYCVSSTLRLDPTRRHLFSGLCEGKVVERTVDGVGKGDCPLVIYVKTVSLRCNSPRNRYPGT